MRNKQTSANNPLTEFVRVVDTNGHFLLIIIMYLVRFQRMPGMRDIHEMDFSFSPGGCYDRCCSTTNDSWNETTMGLINNGTFLKSILISIRTVDYKE